MSRWSLWPVPRIAPPPLRPSRLVRAGTPDAPVVQVPAVRPLRGLAQPVALVLASRTFRVVADVAPVQVPSIRALRGLAQPTAPGRVSRVVTITEGAPAPPVVGGGVYIPTFRPRRR